MADESRIENILDATLGEPGAEVPSPPFSRIEEKLIELKEAIESGGGGGGGTTNYNALTNKPSINGHTLQGNSTLDTLGIASKSTLDAAIEELELMETEIDSKVDKETGKGLSANDFTDTDKANLETAFAKANAAATQLELMEIEIDSKVDKETGKGLSTNDFTNTDKTNLTSALEKANAAAPQSTTYTKNEVDTALAAKLNTADVDEALSNTSTNPVQNKAVRAPIARLVDAGAKNRFDIEAAYAVSVSFNATNALSNSNLSVASNGAYARLSMPYLYKTGTTAFSCIVSEIAISGGAVQIRFSKNSDSSGNIVNPINITGNGEYTKEISVVEDTPGYVIFYLNTATASYQNTAIFSKIMLCSKGDYTVSPEFVPYAPSNRELYEMILALQNAQNG